MKQKLFFAILAASTICVLAFAVLIALFGTTPLLLFAAVVITCALALVLADLISRRLVRSVKNIDLHRPEKNKTYAELTPLLRRLQTQNETIRVQKETIAHHIEDRDIMRREFTANVSHELKTPLTSISGFAELMKNGMVPPETIPEFASDIYNETQRMISLVEDIMHLSQLDENSVPMERTEVDLHALAERVVQRLSPTAKSANVDLRLEGERVTVTGVELLLEEIIYNLASNAIKYNRPGGEAVISTHRHMGQITLTVRDTGIGIPAEHQSRVFERFYRVDKSHSKEVGGTGLGLSIVKHAAAYHEATVSLESTEGAGTTVKVLFGA